MYIAFRTDALRAHVTHSPAHVVTGGCQYIYSYGVAPTTFIGTGVFTSTFAAHKAAVVCLKQWPSINSAEEWQRFRNLTDRWHEERGATSSITQMAMCPSYQKIIAMGPRIVPILIRELEMEGDEPDMWFWALRALTDVDPISDEDRGDFVAMAKAWIEWANSADAA